MSDDSNGTASASIRRSPVDPAPMGAAPGREVRRARPGDLLAILDVHRDAFPTSAEAELVSALAAGGHVVASLVAVEKGSVVGHVLLTRIAIVDDDGFEHTSLALAPVAVVSERQLEGIGSELVAEALDEARRMDAGSVVVLGHANYYPRFGFEPALPRGIRPPFDVPSEDWMVVELLPGALEGVHGTVRYTEPFEGV
jgi:putative acetyltransferase